MYVLVDYDNVREKDRQKGVKYIVDVLSSIICKHHKITSRRLIFRLYGGWYQDKGLTALAQQLSIEIDKEYPSKFVPVKPALQEDVLTLQVELAYAMLVNPNHHLFFTVRPKKLRTVMKVKSPMTVGCTIENCYLKGLKALFRSSKCSHRDCSLTAEQILPVTLEQKLIDVMIASDLLHVAYRSVVDQQPEPIALVTSDDDLLPAVMQVCNTGANVIHINTSFQRESPKKLHYHSSIKSCYSEYSL